MPSSSRISSGYISHLIFSTSEKKHRHIQPDKEYKQHIGYISTKDGKLYCFRMLFMLSIITVIQKHTHIQA